MSINQSGPLGQLVTFENSDGLPLDGILYLAAQNRATIVHVHGSMGNFYHNLFLRKMAERYVQAGINFLPFNLSTHDCIAEGYRFDYSFEYTGGAIALFGTCVADIAAAIGVARGLNAPVILQGHSLGCDRVVHYLDTMQSGLDFVLLSPCDSYRLQSLWIAPETVEEQLVRVKQRMPVSGDEWDWLPVREYGVRSGDEEYTIPITRQAFLSIADGPPFRLFRFDRAPPFSLVQRAIVYVGGKDPLGTADPDTVVTYFDAAIGNMTPIMLAEGDHDLSDEEDTVISRIITWVMESVRGTGAERGVGGENG